MGPMEMPWVVCSSLANCEYKGMRVICDVECLLNKIKVFFSVKAVKVWYCNKNEGINCDKFDNLFIGMWNLFVVCKKNTYITKGVLW